jgi:hypothetical protein
VESKVSDNPLGDSEGGSPSAVGSPIQPDTAADKVRISSLPSSQNNGKERNWLVPALVAVGVITLLAGYLFIAYLHDRPVAIYQEGIARTGDALDALVAYSGNISQDGYKSYDVNGTLRVTGKASYDATLTGVSDVEGNASLDARADIVGEKLDVKLKSVHVQRSASPDLYLQVSGLKQALDSSGLSDLDNLDGQWIAVDHTVIDSYLVKQSHGSSLAESTVLPTAAELHDAEVKAQVVNKQYLFTANGPTSVLAGGQFIGMETRNGRTVYHYVSGYNKVRLKAYLGALGAALDSSSLNNWSKMANGGKTLSQELDIASFQKSITATNTSYAFDIWIDASTKLISAVEFVDPSNGTSIFGISQDYTGGTTYPVTLSFVSKEASGGGLQKVSLGLALDTATNKYTGTLITSEGSTATNFSFTLLPSTKSVTVSTPADAKPIANVLQQLNLGYKAMNL